MSVWASCYGSDPWMFTNICLCFSSSCLHLPGSIAVHPRLLPAGPLPDGTNSCSGLLAFILCREWASSVGNLVLRPYIIILKCLGKGDGRVAHRQPTASWWVCFGGQVTSSFDKTWNLMLPVATSPHYFAPTVGGHQP